MIPRDELRLYANRRREAEKSAAPVLLLLFSAVSWYGFVTSYIQGPFLFTIIQDAFAEKPVFGELTVLQAKIVMMIIGLLQFMGMVVCPILLGLILYKSLKKRV